MAGDDAVRGAFRDQAESCARLGSPFTAWLCRQLAQELTGASEVGRRVLNWSGDPTSSGDSVPLRLCGALHALALVGRREGLSQMYGAPRPGPEIWAEIAAALSAEQDFILAMLDSPPQTNEVSRASMVYPAFCLVAERTGLPVELLEVGASAGLNLNCDRYSYQIGDWQAGELEAPVRLSPELRGAVPSARDPVVAERSGCDLRPFDLSSAAEAQRLLAYVWPDQPERLARTRAAIEIAQAAPPRVERADAASWLSRRLAVPAEGRVRVVYSTIAWQYLTEADRARGEAALAAAGGLASAGAPLAWADRGGPGAALALDLWDREHRRFDLGRGDFHGRWIDWRGAGS